MRPKADLNVSYGNGDPGFRFALGHGNSEITPASSEANADFNMPN
jgi:hypothetical protein